MDAGIQKLRGLLSFGRDRDDHVQAQELRALLESLGAKSPPGVLAALTAHYLPAAGKVSNLHLRFKLLESLAPEIERCLPPLEQFVSTAPLPLDEAASQAALSADNFVKTLASSYAGLTGAIEASKLDSVLGHLLQNAARRSMQYLFRRQMLAYRAYAAPSTSTWLQLHTLYRTTRALRLAQGSSDGQTIENIYVAALLLAYADPNKYRRKEIEGLQTVVTKLARYALVIDAEGVPEHDSFLPSRFFVQTDAGNAGGPLSRVAKGTPRSGHFVIECKNVLTAIDRALEGAAPDDGLGLEARETTLLSLRNEFGGQMTRRFHRQRFKPKAHLVFGMPDLLQFVGRQAMTRRQEDYSSAESPPLGLSEWAIIDESPDGFRVRYHKGEQQQFQTGDVVGLRQKENSRIHICLLRRIANMGRGRLEIGLHALSPGSALVHLPVSLPEPLNQAILLPKLPGFGGKPGLLVFPGALAEAIEIEANLPEIGNRRFRPSTCLESNALMEFHQLETLD